MLFCLEKVVRLEWEKPSQREKTEIVISSANWNNGANTSPFYQNSNNTPSNRNRNISGSRLVNAQKHPVRNGGVLL